MARGKFITLEGGEGVGKTTNLNFMADFLRQHCDELVVTREPGGTPLGELIRAQLLRVDGVDISAEAELLMVFASRMQHLNEKILPALARGAWVLSDRFTDATFAYQGGGRGVSNERIEQLEAWVQNGLQPDLTLLLDLDPTIGMQRAGERGAFDRFEQEEIAFFQRVRSNYQARAASHSTRFRIVDAGQSLDDVQASIASELSRFCGGVG